MHSSELLIASVCAFGTWINAESSKGVHDGEPNLREALAVFFERLPAKKTGPFSREQNTARAGTARYRSRIPILLFFDS
jgi:hypothetical protein